MKMDEAMIDERSLAEAEGEMIAAEVVPSETHAAKWARPPVTPFNTTDKSIIFQVRGLKIYVIS